MRWILDRQRDLLRNLFAQTLDAQSAVKNIGRVHGAHRRLALHHGARQHLCLAQSLTCSCSTPHSRRLFRIRGSPGRSRRQKLRTLTICSRTLTCALEFLSQTSIEETSGIGYCLERSHRGGTHSNRAEWMRRRSPDRKPRLR